MQLQTTNQERPNSSDYSEQLTKPHYAKVINIDIVRDMNDETDIGSDPQYEKCKNSGSLQSQVDCIQMECANLAKSNSPKRKNVRLVATASQKKLQTSRQCSSTQLSIDRNQKTSSKKNSGIKNKYLINS